MLNLTAFDNNMAEITKILASQAGRTSDTLTRDVLAAGTNVMYANGKTSRANLAATDVLKIADIKKAVRLLKRVNAPTINGDYVAIIHPDTTYELMNDSEWVDANKYAGSGRIFEGEIGKMYGVRFVESTDAKVFVGGATPVYGTLVLGQNAFGVTSINGGGIETIVKQLGSGGTADPLNQRATAGWKLNKVAKILTEEYMVRIEHSGSFATGEAN
jgi:N4-gp56 family major capsid protein